MKTIVLSIFLFATMGIYAQGNLQFNQVINVEYSSTGASVTVPAGKTWKIEGCMISAINSYSCMTINGVTYFMRQHNTSSSAWDNFPFWLTEGKTVNFGSNCAGSSGIVSIIEFNIVP
jgi:hypothetical protein